MFSGIRYSLGRPCLCASKWLLGNNCVGYADLVPRRLFERSVLHSSLKGDANTPNFYRRSVANRTSLLGEGCLKGPPSQLCSRRRIRGSLSYIAASGKEIPSYSVTVCRNGKDRRDWRRFESDVSLGTFAFHGGVLLPVSSDTPGSFHLSIIFVTVFMADRQDRIRWLNPMSVMA